jgi:hypothetical protein
MRTVRVLTHVKKLDGTLGDFIVRVSVLGGSDGGLGCWSAIPR